MGKNREKGERKGDFVGFMGKVEIKRGAVAPLFTFVLISAVFF